MEGLTIQEARDRVREQKAKKLAAALRRRLQALFAEELKKQRAKLGSLAEEYGKAKIGVRSSVTPTRSRWKISWIGTGT
jgi:hypothetical protein